MLILCWLGSFGHFQASRSGVHKGGLQLPFVKAGFVATRISVSLLCKLSILPGGFDYMLLIIVRLFLSFLGILWGYFACGKYDSYFCLVHS